MWSVMVRNACRMKWWAYLVQGLIIAFFGLAAIFYPEAVISIAVAFFGLLALLFGVFTLIIAASFGSGSINSTLLLVSGVISGLIGIVAIVFPSATAGVLAFLIALWAILRGISDILFSLTHGGDSLSRLVFAISGLFAFFFGVLLLLEPDPAVRLLVQMLGYFALAYGILTFFAGVVFWGMEPCDLAQGEEPVKFDWKM
jgi:uncharacterized membrane protein HdeD (DUF308 family)